MEVHFYVLWKRKRNKKYSKANPDTHENGVSEFVYCANGQKRIESNLDDSRRIMI